MPVTCERVERLEQLEDDWTRLAEAAGHPFAAWEWSSGWWRRFGDHNDLRAYACRDAEGAVVAILPLRASRLGPLRALRLIGDGDLRGPICAPAERPAAADGLWDVLSQPGNPRLLLADRLPGGEGWGERLGGRLLRTHPDPVLPLAGASWEELLASRSRNFRQQVRRRERRLVEEHGLEFRLSTDPARLGEDMEALIRLHEMRWGGSSSGVFAGPRGEFQREFAAAAQRHGWLRLWLAEIGGETVAAWYGWRFAGSEWYYQAGRDPRFDDLSLGFVLLAHTVREACEDGAESYRFLDGAEPYKWRFASADLGAETRALGHGPRGAAGSLALAAAARAPASIRQRAVRAAV